MGTRDAISSAIPDTIPSADHEAIAWARRHFAFDTLEPVVKAPWSTTHRLQRQGGLAAYLKIVPAGPGMALDTVGRLARRFVGTMPEVLACEPTRGWLLSADHGARTLDYGADIVDLQAVVRSYARMQAEVARSPEQLAGLPQPDLASLAQRLLDFLQPPPGQTASPGQVTAGYFIGADDAALFHRILLRRLGLLDEHLLPAAGLPPTLNHGDLRPPNAAVADDGRGVIIDWDDALVGPAGMSLQGLFEGCTVPSILLSGSAVAQAAASTPNGRLLQAYIDALVQGGYASDAALRRALPASLCAGTLQFIVNFAKFPGESGREAAADTIRQRLSDLLNVCDMLTAPHRDLAFELADEYLLEGNPRRAQGLLQDRVVRQADDVPALTRLGALAWTQGDFDLAAETSRRALRLRPDDASLHSRLADALAAQGELAEAEQALRAALALHPGPGPLEQALARVQDLVRMRELARQPGRMPILRFEPGQAESGQVRPEQVALGAELFNTHGTLQIENAFPVAMIECLQAAFFERYTPYFREADHPDALQLGDKRYMLTVDIEAPFDDAALIGAPTLLPILRRVLGDDCVLGAYTAVISLPGSADQRLHKDHPSLFPDTQWHYTLPCFTAQISIPLVPFDAMTGTTRLHKGTHRISSNDSPDTPHQDPVLPLGACLLTDYRCTHGGRGNRSAQVRPMLSLIFSRPWFRDFANYRQQPPLRLGEAAFERLPDELKPLLAWWMTELKVDTLARSVLR